MKNIIESKNLCKKYKNQLVLDKVSIKVPEGKVYGLLGPNGAGKSTLLKLICQVIRPDSGQIYYKNKPIENKDLLEIGAIIENPAIYPNLTAYENLEILTTLLAIDKGRIDHVLKLVGLDKTGNKLSKDLSLGMKQRLGIAMALINDPKLLILDEPTNGLDPVGISELRELIRSFSKENISVILSSHILSEVDQVADRIGIINEGRLSYEKDKTNDQAELEEIFMQIIKKGDYDE
ncbi:MAG: lantibiotic protection ABC transporter ATP-binding subunit [Anaerococcus sp.]|nr:lantibiotic protection ABC transporter ATP-binding subunit [Peptoniphilaceae bacterium]MDY3054595.1 lantibiotic protection ABC transporter ATP-binding subunit [Anaerococcus sp.]